MFSWANSLGQSIEGENTTLSNSEHERPSLEPILTQSNDDGQIRRTEEPSLISFESTETPEPPQLIRQPSPPPVLAEVQDLIPAISPQVSEVESELETLSSDEFLRAESPLELHIVRLVTIVFFLMFTVSSFFLFLVFSFVCQEWCVLKYVRSF